MPGFGLAVNTGMCNRANLFYIVGFQIPEKYNSTAVGPFVELLTDSADKTVALLGIDSSPIITAVRNVTYSNLTWLPFQAAGNATAEQMTADIQKYSPGTALSLVSAMG